MLTCEQRERLLGMVLMCMRTETACECLGITAADIVEAEDADPMFSSSLHVARICRTAYLNQMESTVDADD